MDAVRFAVIGAGWRARFFIRAAQKLPERFALTGVLCRSQARAEEVARECGVRAVWTMEQLLEDRPSFVVSCVRKADMTKTVAGLLRAGVPALSETPLATELPALLNLYEVYRQTGTPLGLAEQYPLFPSHSARAALVRRGVVGDAVSCALSTAHDYHAVALLRAYLGEARGPVRIAARKMETPVAITGSRAGYQCDGGMGKETRVFASFAYADGRLGLYDFSGVQYHSAIRSRHVRVLGTRGELFDDDVAFVGADGRPMQERLLARRDLLTGTIASIDACGARVYENPFRADVAMDEDEIAVAATLAGMAKTACSGAPLYPVRWAFEDAYLAILLAEAAETGEERVSRPMPWDEA